MQHAPVQVADLEAKPIERRIFEGRRLAEDPKRMRNAPPVAVPHCFKKSTPCGLFLI